MKVILVFSKMMYLFTVGKKDVNFFYELQPNSSNLALPDYFLFLKFKKNFEKRGSFFNDSKMIVAAE